MVFGDWLLSFSTKCFQVSLYQDVFPLHAWLVFPCMDVPHLFMCPSGHFDVRKNSYTNIHEQVLGDIREML
jgi:hypothetical protein